MKFIFVITCFFFVTLSLSAQSYYYEAYAEGLKVGDIKAVREVNDEAEKISITISVKLPESEGYQFEFMSSSSYVDGRLVDANSIIKINGNTTISEIVYKDGNYISNLGGNSRILKESVLYADDLLYFEEPVGLNKIYILATDIVVLLTTSREDTWQIDDDKGIRTLTYTESILTSIAWKFSDRLLVFKLKE